MGIFSGDNDFCDRCARINCMSIAEIADERLNEMRKLRQLDIQEISGYQKEVTDLHGQLRAAELKIQELQSLIIEISNQQVILENK